MELTLHAISNAGELAEERVVIDVHRRCSLLTFVLFNNAYGGNGKPSNQVKHSYWLPNGDVRRGDVVIIYTRSGDPSATQHSNGTTTYFYFMGLSHAIWQGEDDCAVLARIDRLESMQVRPPG